MTRREISDLGGNLSLVLAFMVLTALSLYSCFLQLPHVISPGAGLLLPPVAAWGLMPFLSLGLNILLLLLTAVWLIAINRRFNFIPSTSVLYATLFLFMAGANPYLSGGLNPSTLLALANVAAVQLLFSQYGRLRINPAPIFIIGTIFSFGSMVHYSFLFFVIIYGCAAGLLKTFGVREFAALLLGVLTPYWIVLGSGLIPVSALHIPVIGGVWQASVPGREMFWLIFSASITALWGLLAGLRNEVALYSASTATRAYFHALALPALLTVVLMLIDWENFMVYYVSLCLFAAIQGGYLAALGNHNAKPTPLWFVVAVVYIFFTIMSSNNFNV